jgi:copper chaperone CopZ
LEFARSALAIEIRKNMGRAMSGALAAVILLALGQVATSAKEIVVAVPGIPGPYCAYGAEKRLLELNGVEAVTVSWESELIRILVNDSARITAEDIKQAMKRADYPYKYEVRMDADR